MSTHNICFRREIKKNIDTLWLKKYLIKSYVVYYGYTRNKICMRETITIPV